MGKFNKILNIDYENKCVVTQPGVTNLGITHAVQHKGFYYAPDPSSQLACSIGGNVAENSGGVHSLKYGTTTNNILGVEMVLMDGTICRFGGKTLDQEGYDLMGLICGSEGLLGVVTEVTVKILKKPKASEVIAHYWPMRGFVHHNPLHNLEHMHFQDAVSLAQRFTGGKGYLSNETYRGFVESERILPKHVDDALEPLIKQEHIDLNGSH